MIIEQKFVRPDNTIETIEVEVDDNYFDPPPPPPQSMDEKVAELTATINALLGVE